MSIKKIDLLFDFRNEIPQQGSNNVYKKLAPGAKVNKQEGLMQSLRAERFSEYERVFRELVSLIGPINFNEYNFEDKDKTIGNILTTLLARNINLTEKIQNGSTFPIKEIIGIGVLRSFSNEVNDSSALLDYGIDTIVGEINLNPEFEIQSLTERRLELLGGKVVFNNNIIDFNKFQLEQRLNYFVDLNPPKISKNVEFDTNTSTFPQEQTNRLVFKWNPSASKFEARIPIVKASNGQPYRWPLETETFDNGIEAASFQLTWNDNGTERLLSGTNAQISLSYENNETDKPIIQISPIVFVNANPDPSASDSSKELETYIFYYYNSWRIDTVAANSVGNIELISGLQEYIWQENDFGFSTVPLYTIVVSCYDPDINKVINKNTDWYCKGSFTGVFPNKNVTFPTTSGNSIQDRRRFVIKEKTIPVNLENQKQTKLIPTDSKLVTSKGKFINSAELETSFGKKHIVKSPTTSKSLTNYKTYITDQWQDIVYFKPYENLNDTSNITFAFAGVSFVLFTKPLGFPEEEIPVLPSYITLEYQIIEDGGDIVLHGSTHYPQNSIPETLEAFRKDVYNILNDKLYTIKVRLVGANPDDKYFILGESANSFGNGLQVVTYNGVGLKENNDQFEFINYEGSTSGFKTLNSFSSLTSTTISRLNKHSFSFIDHSGIVGNLSFSHNSLDYIDNNKYLNIDLDFKDTQNPTYVGKSSQKISFVDFPGINNSEYESVIEQIHCKQQGSYIHFAVVFLFYDRLSGTNRKNTILTGIIIPRLGNFCIKSNFIGNVVDYPYSAYGQTKFITKNSSIVDIKKDLQISGDHSGNKSLGFLSFVSGSYFLDLFVFGNRNELGASVRYDVSGLNPNAINTIVTSELTGAYSTVGIIKQDVSTGTVNFKLVSFMLEPGAGSELTSREVLLKQLTSFDIPVTVTATEDAHLVHIERKDKTLKLYFVKKISSVWYLETQVLNITTELVISLIKKGIIELTGFDSGTVPSVIADGINGFVVGKTSLGEICTYQFNGLETKFNYLVHTTDANELSILAKDKTVVVVSNPTSGTTNTLYTHYESTDLGIDYDGLLPSIEKQTEGLYFGYAKEDVAFEKEEIKETNIVADPYFVYEWQKNGVNLVDNYYDVTLTSGQYLSYTLAESVLKHIDLAKLEDKVLVVRYKSDNPFIEPNVVVNGGTICPLLSEVDGWAWFKLPAITITSITITLTNKHSSTSCVVEWCYANTGFIPVELPKRINIPNILADRYIPGSLSIHNNLLVNGPTGTTFRVSSTEDSVSSTTGAGVIEGGLSVKKRLSVGQLDGRIPLGSVVAVVGTRTAAANAGTVIDPGSVPASGIVSDDGMQFCDGVETGEGAILTGYVPDLTDNRFIQGSSSFGIMGGNINNQKTLAESEIPSHSHTGNTNYDNSSSFSVSNTSTFDVHYTTQISGGSITGTENNLGQVRILVSTGGDSITQTSIPISSSGNFNHNHSFTSNNTGGSGAFDIRPEFMTGKYVMRVGRLAT